MSSNPDIPRRKQKNIVAERGSANVSRRAVLFAGTALAAASSLAPFVIAAQAQDQTSQPAPTGSKPNILIIWGDDIGYWNISA